jgi:hypothetical protein
MRVNEPQLVASRDVFQTKFNPDALSLLLPCVGTQAGKDLGALPFSTIAD